jgi:O-antigen/teichoic acid export membrane protein
MDIYKSKLFSNSSWIMIEKIITMLINIFVIALIARHLGPDIFGEFNFALSFVALFTAISTLGLDTIAVKSIIDEKEKEGSILCTILILRITSCVLIILLSWNLIRYLEPENNNIQLLVLIMSFSMLAKSLEVIEYWIQANLKAKFSSIIRISVFSVTLFFKLTLVLNNGNLISLSIIFLLDTIFIGIALFITYFIIRKDTTTWNFNFKFAKEILMKSWYLILSGLMVTIYMRIDQIMIGKMNETTYELGIYSAAARIAEMWYFIPGAIIVSYTPTILKNKNESFETYINSIQKMYSIIAIVGLVFCAFIILFSKIIILILYGQEYLEASKILVISLWGGLFATLGSARGIWLVSENLQKYSILYISIGAIVNVLLNFVLIPTYGGIGAAWATLAAQISVVIVVPLLLKKTRNSSIMILNAFRFKTLIKKKYFIQSVFYFLQNTYK